ncbi:single-stranded DNA-binding protein [Mucilaginibacter kameinonensis]|uniref:single-stranded DNA-binding protein n=1 Tax=Mucilaginibacter kameinonensis TaxID=452286 RepID=UPI000EF7D200|nr:single-stranded DNA-binding protein [Mucilaginibacter kameinonensis]
MSGINKIILVGYVGEDPTIRYVDPNVAVTSFILITAERTVKNGIKTEHTECHHIVMLRAAAEHAFKVLAKGKLICVEGKLQTLFLEDSSGLKKVTKIVALDFRLLDRNSDFEYMPDRKGV